MPPKIIDKVDFSFKIDESIISQDEAEAMYNQMRQITKDFRTQTMKLNDRSDSNTLAGQGFLAPAIINDANIRLTEEEHQLLKLGPKFILNDPKTVTRRRRTQLATLKRKIEKCFLHKKVHPGRPLQQFMAELDVLLQTLHTISTVSKNLNKDKIVASQTDKNDIIELINSQASQSQVLNVVKVKKKKNYGRLVKRLKHKFKLANVILQKSDKSKVFHLGKVEDYRKKSEQYMDKTQAYKCLGKEDPLPELIQRTNKYLLDLRLAKWITQKHYELLNIKPNEVELAHLYYLPKARKPGTPLRPIISGLKHPTIKISKFLDDLLRPLFDKMAQETTVTSGFELVKTLQKWSILNMNGNTIFCTIDVVDLYTMIPQLNSNINSFATFLDLYMENRDGVLFTTVYQKPSYEPYYLPFNSIHPLHMKKNIPFTMLLRVIRYCSTFQTYLDEREKLRMTLLLNKYPNKLIEEQFNNVLLKCNIDQPLINSNYDKYRQKVIDSPMKQKATIDYEAVMFIHFTYCSTMKTFPAKFHLLWHKYFQESPINEVRPILGTRNFHEATTTAPITTTVTTNATTDALPQREIFARRNTTQPFTVNENYQNQRVQQQQGNQRQRKTTSSFRRRQRRNNRFAVLADENENDNISDVEVEMNDESMPLNANKKQRTDKNKTFGGY
ncbi:unnamed protein product [Rotaria sordida]|uniref:Helix-turn-helix domain-containing protein n=1 Tax=Rotaria sordida TaxID=392033 RepID=A0A815BEQ4_9BILA|nr:unnamed protein product [Rotaria sordida]